MDVSNEGANMSAKGKIIWGACQPEGSPENFLKLDSLKHHFQYSLDWTRISLQEWSFVSRCMGYIGKQFSL